MKFTLAALLLLAATPAILAVDSSCPRFLHSASQSEQQQLADRGMDIFQNFGWEFCDSLPKYITDPSYYQATTVAQCSNDDTSTAVFNFNFKPRTPCNCTAPYCTQGKDGSCTCDKLPSNYNETTQALVYFKPQDCNPYGNVTDFINVKYTVGEDKLPLDYNCPTGFRKATTADRGIIVGVLEQVTKNYIWPQIQNDSNNSDYFCDAGIRSMGYPLNVRTRSCIKKPGYVATINGKKYKGSDKIAIVRGTVQYQCFDQARQKNIGIDSATVRYQNACYPTLYPYPGN